MKKDNPSDSERYLGLGLQLAGTILLGFFAGMWFDRRFGTLPWGLLAGTTAGFLAGFLNFLVQMKRTERDSDENK